MDKNTKRGVAVLLAASLSLMLAVACTTTPVSPVAPTATVTLKPTDRPPAAPTPTLEERRNQTPTDFGYNTRVLDGNIHVWHVPHCPPVPPATFVASIILTDLSSGSHLYLNRDGSVKASPLPDYRSAEAEELFAAVLGDTSMMERILVPFECP